MSYANSASVTDASKATAKATLTIRLVRPIAEGAREEGSGQQPHHVHGRDQDRERGNLLSLRSISNRSRTSTKPENNTAIAA